MKVPRKKKEYDDEAVYCKLATMSAAPFVVNNSGSGSSSNNVGGANTTKNLNLMAHSRDLTGSRLFQFYMESFFKIPKDIKNDIIYCQRALKAHIKVHQVSEWGKWFNKMAKILLISIFIAAVLCWTPLAGGWLIGQLFYDFLFSFCFKIIWLFLLIL